MHRSSDTSPPPPTPLPQRVKVIIIGAGAAGLAAANELLCHPSNPLSPSDIIILEGRSRPGGRISTHCYAPPALPPTSIDDGAAWVHGVGTIDDPNPMVSLIALGGGVLDPVVPVGNPWLRPREALHGFSFSKLYNPEGIAAGSSASSSFADDNVSSDGLDTPLPSSSLLGLYVGGYRPLASHTALAVRQFEVLLYATSVVGLAGLSSGSGASLRSLRLRTALEVVRRNPPSSLPLNKISSLPAQTRAIIRLHLHLLECWDSASLSDMTLSSYACEEAKHTRPSPPPTSLSDDAVPLFKNWVFQKQRSRNGDFAGAHCKVKDGGMEKLIKGLLTSDVNERLRLDCIVASVSLPRVEDAQDQCTVTMSDGRRVTSEVVICTLPLGVMQRAVAETTGKIAGGDRAKCCKREEDCTADVKFEPPLPAWKTSALRAMSMGSYKKVFLHFENIFWDPLPPFLGVVRVTNPSKTKLESRPGTLNLGDRLLLTNLWAREGKPFLEASLVGDAAKAAYGLPDERVVEAVIELMKLCMQPTAIFQPLVHARVSHWEIDPFSRGSYSYSGVDFRAGDCARARKRVWAPQPPGGGASASSPSSSCALLFAGEHCDEEMMGSVHAAIETGREAAREALDILEGSLTASELDDEEEREFEELRRQETGEDDEVEL